MENKNQHWNPASYLKAWVDLDLPKGREGQIWVYAKDGSLYGTKSPKNSMFCESDFYTKEGPGGSRDITLEKRLAIIEKDFSKVRSKVDSSQDLTSEDISALVVFISVMRYRTKVYRDNEKNQWEHILNVMNDQAENSFSALLPLRKSSGENSLSRGEVIKIVSEPIQSILFPASEITSKILVKMNMHIVCTTTHPGFITSDHPCVIFDPLYTSEYPALGCPSIEITLPISPKRLAIFFWSNVLRESCKYSYVEANEEMVDEFNRRTRFFCNEHFIVNVNTKKDFWFA